MATLHTLATIESVQARLVRLKPWIMHTAYFWKVQEHKSIQTFSNWPHLSSNLTSIRHVSVLFCFILWVSLEQDVDWNEIRLRSAPAQPHVSRKHCRCWYWTHFFWSHNQKSVNWGVRYCNTRQHWSLLWDKSRVSASQPGLLSA